MEKIARGFIIVLVAGVLALPFFSRWLTEPVPVTADVIELHARMPENGGWSLDTIQAKAGQPLTLRLTSDDVMHSFAVAKSDQAPVDIAAGEWTTTTLVFDKPGQYTYYCTRWCGPNHWRMRGVIEVGGDQPNPTAAEELPLFLELNLDLDAPHPAENVPEIIPSAARGAQFAELLPVYTRDIRTVQSTSPSDLWARLRGEKQLANLDDLQIWDAVAWVYARLPGGQDLGDSAELFRQNCQACHGAQGKGDGVMVRDLPPMSDQAGMGHEATRPPDFSDAKVLLGASPALLEGKIIRGGMGTGMPNWGSIFTREQIQGLTLYLYLFQMNFEEVQ